MGGDFPREGRVRYELRVRMRAKAQPAGGEGAMKALVCSAYGPIQLSSSVTCLSKALIG